MVVSDFLQDWQNRIGHVLLFATHTLARHSVGVAKAMQRQSVS